MKRVFGRIILCVSALATLASCSDSLQSQTPSENPTVLTYMPQSDGTYGFVPFELLGVRDLKAVASRFVNFFVAPHVAETDGQKHLEGSSPNARYIRSQGGTYTAMDNFTLELFTISAHMQKLAALDEELGAKGVNTWPRDIGVAVRVEGGMDNNAQYFGDADAMFFVRYTKSNLPIAVNAGVLAHEHFHSLFFKLVKTTVFKRSSIHSLSKLLEDTDSKTEADGRVLAPKGIEFDVAGDNLSKDATVVYMKGLNEGFADFWGWMYVNDPDFVARSLPEVQRRSLKVSTKDSDIPLSFKTVQLRLQSEKPNLSEDEYAQFINGYAYALGSSYARMLKAFTDKIIETRKFETEHARKFVAQALLKVLPLLNEKTIGPDQVISLFAQQVPELQEQECWYLQSTLAATAPVKDWTCKDMPKGFQLLETP